MIAPPGTPFDGRPVAAQFMYGSGLRVIECVRLRVKDLDFDQGTITIHDGKGGKHRVVPLPSPLDFDYPSYSEFAPPLSLSVSHRRPYPYR